MRKKFPEIKLYGRAGCHKTQYYQSLLEKIGLPFAFLDVEQNEAHAAELRSLYTEGKLHYPTITIGSKKLRNPTKEALLAWLHKRIPSMVPITHDKERRQYVLAINQHLAVVQYQDRDGKRYLVHSEVPYNLRGRGLGEVLVLKTFEKLKEEEQPAVAVCSFIKKVRDAHPTWKALIE